MRRSRAWKRRTREPRRPLSAPPQTASALLRSEPRYACSCSFLPSPKFDLHTCVCAHPRGQVKGGNHDARFKPLSGAAKDPFCLNVHVIKDRTLEINGVPFYGSPRKQPQQEASLLGRFRDQPLQSIPTATTPNLRRTCEYWSLYKLSHSKAARPQ